MNAASRLARRQGESILKHVREYSELAVAGVGAPGRYVDTMPTVLPWTQSLSFIQPSKVRAVLRYNDSRCVNLALGGLML